MTGLFKTIVFGMITSILLATTGVGAKEPAVSAKGKAPVVRSLVTIGEARTAAKRIGRGFFAFAIDYKTGKEVRYKVRQLDAVLSDARTLTIHNRFCGAGRDCKKPEAWRVGQTKINLAALDKWGITVFYNKGSASFVMFSCRGQVECARHELGSDISTTAQWVAVCDGSDKCRRMEKDLRALIVFAKNAQAAAPSHTSKKKRSADPSNRPGDKLAIGKRFRPPLPTRPGPLKELSDSLLGADILVAVTEGSTLRLLRGVGATQDGKGRLVVHRDVCLALIEVGNPQVRACDSDDRRADYDLVIDLAAVDLNSILPDQGGYWAGEKGSWISARCRPRVACARLSVLSRSPRAKVQRKALLRSFRETAAAPKIRLPCRDAAGCRKAAQALRALVKGAGADRISGMGRRLD